MAEQVGVKAPGRPNTTMRLPATSFETGKMLAPSAQPGVSCSMNSLSAACLLNANAGDLARAEDLAAVAAMIDDHRKACQ